MQRERRKQTRTNALQMMKTMMTQMVKQMMMQSNMPLQLVSHSRLQLTTCYGACGSFLEICPFRMMSLGRQRLKWIAILLERGTADPCMAALQKGWAKLNLDFRRSLAKGRTSCHTCPDSCFIWYITGRSAKLPVY
jgi:hypothetical protein